MKSGVLAVPLLLLGVVLLLVLVHHQDPAEAESSLPGCALRSASGFHCPGCGATRATHQLLHGNLSAALDHNALVLPILFLAGYSLLAWGVGLSGKHHLPQPRQRWFWWVVAGVFLVFGVLRNLPWPPFSALAP